MSRMSRTSRVLPRISPPPSAARRLGLLALLALPSLLVGCPDPEPRYGAVSVSASAPRASLSGSTFGHGAALELGPGCPGFLEPEIPGHLIHLASGTRVRVSARSEHGPLAMVIGREGGVDCDSDEGSGHEPHISLSEAGDYQVWVASLREAAALPYQLSIEPEEAPDQTQQPTVPTTTDVSVTVTSRPPGATVRDAGGQSLGTTPLMFLVQVPNDEMGGDRSYRLELEGYESREVSGQLAGESLVLHADLTRLGPTELTLETHEQQPIVDFQSTAQSVQVDRACAVAAASLDVDIEHSYISDLRVVLRPPAGREISLHRHGGGARANLQRTFAVTDRNSPLRGLVGQDGHGRWELVVYDDAGADHGTFNGFTLHLTCAPPGATPGGETPPTGAAVRPGVGTGGGGAAGGGGGGGVRMPSPAPIRRDVF